MNAASRCDRSLPIPEQRPALFALEGLLADLDAPKLLVLHGPAGSGKSHLVQSVVGDLPSTVRVIAAGDLKNDDASDEPDLLVVEDLQFLPLTAVEMFLARLDDRQAHDLPTIVTASAGPRHLRFRGKPFPARLTSRLAAGLVVGVPLPSLANRRAIVEALLRDVDLTVSDAVIDHLACVNTTLRAIEGAVGQLGFLSRLDPKQMKAGSLLDHLQQQAPPERASVDRIVQRVAGYFHVTPKDVRSRSRRRGFVIPRHVSMYLARRLTRLSFQEIGTYFTNCDHTTVVHACRRMEETIETDPQLGGAVRQLHDDLV